MNENVVKTELTKRDISNRIISMIKEEATHVENDTVGSEDHVVLMKTKSFFYDMYEAKKLINSAKKEELKTVAVVEKKKEPKTKLPKAKKGGTPKYTEETRALVETGINEKKIARIIASECNVGLSYVGSVKRSMGLGKKYKRKAPVATEPIESTGATQ